jgi:hypothetical protein
MKRKQHPQNQGIIVFFIRKYDTLIIRVTAEARNATGQSLLSIAAQRDDELLAHFLLTYWKTCDTDRFFAFYLVN